ncbi:MULTISPECIES: DUF1697 domain-containing protein [Novosphingobium]|jgi:uncharacterized protein (DUF1697 family)|uniref:Uncharacterized conserved protein, DUF1697 family n=1 Tax=Novosphingobium panipatense TaxID=428991 RepID=A0ABY1Q8Z0_9SPHN|nr:MULTISPECIES: DUF1697 domain-containing protein [Novosphingobium]SMP62339.1 Uncharacterized conserved protein, DUF1697 family [Novosphingobium panipatense]
MTRYCAFFAAINVGGNRLTMADLRYAFEREEFENVETVVASGNVLFDFDERPTEGLEELFAYMMKDRFDMTTFAAVRTREEVRSAVEDNPFTGIGQDHFVHTLFLERDADPEHFDRMVADHSGRGPEKIALGPRCLYIDYVDGVGGSKLTSAFIERRLGCRGTARNVRSLARIHSKMG